MIMIGEHGPGFELPAKLSGNGEQAAMQHAQPCRAAKVMSFPVGGGGDKISAPFRKLMRRCVRPGRLGFRHEKMMLGEAG